MFISVNSSHTNHVRTYVNVGKQRTLNDQIISDTTAAICFWLLTTRSMPTRSILEVFAKIFVYISYLFRIKQFDYISMCDPKESIHADDQTSFYYMYVVHKSVISRICVACKKRMRTFISLTINILVEFETRTSHGRGEAAEREGLRWDGGGTERDRVFSPKSNLSLTISKTSKSTLPKHIFKSTNKLNFGRSNLSNPKPEHITGESGRGGARREGGAGRGRAAPDADGTACRRPHSGPVRYGPNFSCLMTTNNFFFTI